MAETTSTSFDASQKPRLRPLEAVAFEQEGRAVVALRDPLRYSDALLLLPPEAMLILARFDGRTSVRDVQEELMRATGEIVPAEEIGEIVQKLDECYFLENSRFAERWASLRQEFSALPRRPAAHAGEAYPADAAEARKTLDGYREKARLLPEDSAAEGSAAAKIILPPGVERPARQEEGRALRGLIAPHIDPRRGGACAYKAFEATAKDPADVYVIFGTAHGDCETPYALTRKGYETPLGVAETETAIVDTVASSCGEEVFADEYAHRTEHSIEFAVVYLQHVLASRKFRIVPVLCGSLFRAVQTDTPPDLADLRVARFHLALAAEIARTGKKVCFVAAADLSHVGQRFGDPKAPDAATLAEVERYDRGLLGAAAGADAAAFDALVRSDRDRHRICGYPPVYALLRATSGASGRLLRYEQSVERDTGSVVSYASLALHAAA